MSNIIHFINKYERSLTIIGLLFFTFLAVIILVASIKTGYIAPDKPLLHDIEYVSVAKQNGTIQTIALPKAVYVDEPFDILVDLAPYKSDMQQSIVTIFEHCNVYVYGDGKLIYELKKPPNSLTKSGGYEVVVFDVPNDLKNQTITIHIEPLLKSVNYYKVDEIKYGRKCDVVIDMLKSDGLKIIISAILILNYFVMLIVIFRKREFLKNENYRIFHLSILGFLTAVYFLAHLWSFNYFLAAYKEFIYFSEYMSLLLVLVPASLYMSSKLDPKFSKLFGAIVIVLLANNVTQFTLTLLQIIEFKEMIFITHGFMYISILYIFIAITLTDGKKYPSKYSLILPVAAIIIATVIPLIYYLLFRLLIFKLLAPIITISVIILETMELYVKYMRYKRGKIEKEIYKQMAITDSLTDLPNRQAHEKYIKDIENNKIAGWIMSVDLNSLKYINDKYGHMMGDKLIVDFANLLKKLKRENNQIHPFRIGGDEFFVFIEADNCFEIKSLIVELKEAYNLCDGYEGNFVPTFSVGYHYFDPTMNDNVISVYNIADKLMYDDKIRYKKRFRNRINIT